MNYQLTRLNCLRRDFIKWAESNEPSIYELDVNKIGGSITGYSNDDEPIILLDCTKNSGEWYICKNSNIDSIDSTMNTISVKFLQEEQIHDIRLIVESWLVKKDINLF